MTRKAPQLDQLRPHFGNWQKTGDIMDQLIDLQLNLRQSGHPGGSRSKVPAMVTLTLSGAMRWDVRNPELPWGDRFVLVAGHTTPMAYSMLAVYNEALRRMYKKTGDEKYSVPGGLERMMVWEDLLNFRHINGPSGHAECVGKTLFLKSNTGPSGHGAPAAAGIALALKLVKADDVRVFAIEGEGGLTAGGNHETKHTSYGLGLSNFNYLLDWNDYGIDDRPFSDVVYGTPQEWFSSYGFITNGAEDGTDFEQLCTAMFASVFAEGDRPRCTWFKTIKGRGYGVTGNKSHGAAHKPNNEVFWATKKEFADKYGVEFEGFGEGRPESNDDFRAQTATNMQIALSLLDDEDYCAWLADTLVAIGDTVPREMPGARVNGNNDPADDPELTDPKYLPASLFFAPGESQPNRKGFSLVASYINAVGRRKYGRPVVIACSADLADSTNISGFAKDWEGSEGWGWYKRGKSEDGALLPTAITEFGNSGLMCGLASTNFSDDPENSFNGFWGACSTYGSFSYLKYGPMRLFSQQMQDCELKGGKVIWVAGHSGPETAEDSRTHFGVFSPGITQFFPKGQVIDLHPWEPNEVGPALLAALGTDAPIVAIHLTRPNVEIPDREALGMASYMDAAKGAYIMRDYDLSRPKEGCIFLRGTSSTNSIHMLLKRGAFDGDGPNVKIVAAISMELFDLQTQEYRESVASEADWIDSTFITNGARQMMRQWTAHRVSSDYGMGSDWDDRWRSGGSGDEVIAEAHLDQDSLLEGITKFANDRELRLEKVRGPECLHAQPAG